jgi:hypothetical protein
VYTFFKRVRGIIVKYLKMSVLLFFPSNELSIFLPGQLKLRGCELCNNYCENLGCEVYFL